MKQSILCDTWKVGRPLGHALGCLLAVLAFCSVAASADDAHRPLRVCADPDNLPFSNERLEGFENRIAGLLAEDMATTVRYTWTAQRRGFLRRSLQSGTCDVVIGVPVGLSGLLATRPYYASSYVFVTDRARGLLLHDFDAPVLRELKIGLQALGAENANTPPAGALARRGLGRNVVGFPMWGENGALEARSRILQAVAAGDIDTAIVWGPLAGYHAREYGGRLVLAPVTADPKAPDVPFVYEIAVGVRGEDYELRARLQQALDRRRPQVEAILEEYGVPRVRPDMRLVSRTASGAAEPFANPEQEH